MLLVLIKSHNIQKSRYVKNRQWYEELTLTSKQKLFSKKLFGLEPVYESTDNIEIDFIEAFSV